jgi:hypothetical protein
MGSILREDGALSFVCYGKHKVRIQFDGCWLDFREFTINFKPLDPRGFCHSSAFFSRSLEEFSQEITVALFSILELSMKLNKLKVENEEQYELLDTLVK